VVVIVHGGVDERSESTELHNYQPVDGPKALVKASSTSAHRRRS
jgi:hypothetical protein